MKSTPLEVVVADVRVLVRLVERGCLRRLRPRLVVVEEVRRDIVRLLDWAAVEALFGDGGLRVEPLSEMVDLVRFAELTVRLGRGEAASLALALALAKGWCVASDETARFRLEAERCLGKGRLVRSATLCRLAIRLASDERRRLASRPAAGEPTVGVSLGSSDRP